ncbi:TPA: hypothetical protein ACID9U_003609 [Pseudomonas aeruginosa]|uniref:hypothetical protein n=1 Tax=Pseudomonas aeruginosa TaxID=287 RepID=UPI00160052F5|nr:hypothetical protein [Pseudomonas aeruginosa]EKI2989042.1 hypothetical protein [Pseudomonas aeruginosa]EKV5567106.1 hypothetical protein [Pseudomonas aeruginosa]ELK6922566.1 hypothetical protein [Pseudomonas aeruginosa]ELK9798254.1 hypothetical protein [Pseudomonas aeruginosa]ELR6320639.1 hypothetical protein [Pseudomonas aeruginosa]
MTASKIQMDQIRSTSATVTGENIRAGSQKKSSLSPAEGLQGASPDATCTCPSGGGSLRHPCPAHPAVEQAGGDERDFQAEGAQEVPSPVSQEYDRHLISLLRKGEALPGHQEEAADEIERLRDWNDHLNNTVLPNILNPNFLMLMKGGERLLDLCTKDGKFIGVSLNDMKDVFDWMVTHARIAPDHAALAQPSPASDLDPLNLAPHAEAFNEAPAEALKPEPAEADRPEVVAWQYRVTAGPQTGWSLWHPGKGEEFERSYTVERRPLMTVAQHERIVGELRAVIAQLRQHKNDYMDSGQETYRALQNEIREREAEIARLDGLVSSRTTERDAALARVAELERQEPVALANRGLHAFWVKWTEAAAGLYGPGIKLYAAPVAQAQHSVPVPVVTPEMVMAAMAVFRLDASPFKSMEAALIAALRKAAAPNEKRSCEYAGCCSTAHPGTSLCIAHHSKKVQEQLLAAAPGKEGV